ncbi:PREDICTED: putative acyl-coenzyme A oxidase 3.2, peroxisomal [Ipomoea nil]|uniref:putative acyl-coenzyme A oxidase 3.2, peroxisomal n=1 Tax=Ipomoea nil TaxID=35883 RepID=UPI0009017DA5|nr:PREDICTED: putative acyl-coenzyme A oxidase 3.2, peroxisomal [Ipomoea nil]
MVHVRGGAILFLGTKRHHDEWLRDTENYAVKDVSLDGKYLTAIKDPDRRFGSIHGAFDNRACNHTIHCNLLSKTIAIRYSLTRRAFSVTPNGPEALLLDYPSHQRRLLPLLAKIYAMSFATNFLKRMYVKRKPETIKTLHVVSSAFKATLSWHNMRTLQVVADITVVIKIIELYG